MSDLWEALEALRPKPEDYKYIMYIQCCHCKQFRGSTKAAYQSEDGPLISHTICPKCMAKYYGNIVNTRDSAKR